jgi:putative hydrolase of the HAD superfamily
MIKTIIFDFGDVLVKDRTKDPVFLSMLHKLPKYQRRLNKTTSLKSETGKIPYSQMIKFDKKFLFPNKSAKEIETYFLKTQVLPCWKLAKKLAKNHQIIIFSNHHRGAPEKTGKLLGINVRQFPFVNSAVVGMRKPHLQFYRYLIKRHHLKPQECLFIDDRERNLPPARKLGIHTYLYDQNFPRLVRYLKRLGIAC